MMLREVKTRFFFMFFFIFLFLFILFYFVSCKRKNLPPSFLLAELVAHSRISFKKKKKTESKIKPVDRGGLSDFVSLFSEGFVLSADLCGGRGSVPIAGCGLPASFPSWQGL